MFQGMHVGSGVALNLFFLKKNSALLSTCLLNLLIIYTTLNVAIFHIFHTGHGHFS